MNFTTRGLLAIAATLALSACGSMPQSTGVMQTSPDNYKIVYRSSFGNAIKSQGTAMQLASAFCEVKKNRLQVNSSRTYGLMSADNSLEGAFEVQFTCVR